MGDRRITNECLTSAEMGRLESADTPKKWLHAHDIILDRRGGQYPPDWREKTLELYVRLIESF